VHYYYSCVCIYNKIKIQSDNKLNDIHIKKNSNRKNSKYINYKYSKKQQIFLNHPKNEMYSTAIM